nr:pep11 peptide [Rotifer birnavirus strain Palavas]
ASGTPITRASA